MLVAAVLAVLLIVPAFALLYTLDQKSLLPEEGVEEGPDQATGSRAPDRSLSSHAADPATAEWTRSAAELPTPSFRPMTLTCWPGSGLDSRRWRARATF